MTKEELLKLLDEVQETKCETQTLEIKAAKGGCPEIYDTLSAFSNQSDGGTILFGVDEKNGFQEKGVQDAQKLQKSIVEKCEQMEPVIRPLLTAVKKNNEMFVSAEIAGLDVSNRPCYYKKKGQTYGSFIRVGDADKHMSDQEIYNYLAYRKKYEDDIRILKNVPETALDMELVAEYIRDFRKEKKSTVNLGNEEIVDLMSILKDGHPSLSSLLLFGKYPQAYVPNLCINAVVVPGTELGDTGEYEERFIDSERIEGKLPEMLDDAEAFVRRNEKMSIIIDENGKRTDREEYPARAVREVMLNALEHRDYSANSEGKPILIRMFSDRLEVHSPGGLFGRMEVQDLGKKQPDSRNPHLVSMMELLGITENRYSGIPTIRKECEKNGVREPLFQDEHGTFIVTLFNKDSRNYQEAIADWTAETKITKDGILRFCQTPRTRAELNQFLGLSSTTYGFNRYIKPLVASGDLVLEFPDNPGSKKQTYTTKYGYETNIKE